MYRFFLVKFLILFGISQITACQRPNRHFKADKIADQPGDTREIEKKQKRVKGFYYVTKVVDGDTFWVDDGSKEGAKIRLIGIDAPETRNTRHKKKGHLAKEVKSYVTDLIEGKWVRLEYDVRRMDQYKRTLAYVYLEDQTFLNAHLVEMGYATVDTHPPNIKFVDVFVAAQRKARQSGKGVWFASAVE